MNVLKLVNTRRSFFDTQVEALERQGVDCTVQTVPGTHTSDSGHSAFEYARFYASVLGRAREDYDVVHAHYGLLGPLALAQPTRPVVLTLWGSDVMGHTDRLDWVSTRSARLADAAIVPWSTMSPYLDCEHHVVPWAVDTDLFEPMDREVARAKLDWDHDDPVALFPYDPGRPVKNADLATTVTDRAEADVRLETMSGVPYDRVPLYMNASDVVLVTSTRESGPMVLPEAAACNVPVVSTDVGIAADFLADISNSVVAASKSEFVDALDRLLTDRPRSDGREAALAMSLERTGERLLEIYESVRADRDDGHPRVRSGSTLPPARITSW